MDFFTKLEHLISSQRLSSRPCVEVLAEHGSPSTSIAVLDNGDITSRCISTLGDDDQTLFQACSISKPVAGMATMRLVQQGKLRIEDKISDILPESVLEILATEQSRPLLAHVTVKHLMSHTSGLSVHGYPGYPDQVPDVLTVLSGKKPANTLRVCLNGMPGHAFSYSGGGITVLQVLLETITKKDFPSLVQELVFQPLDMSRSFYNLSRGELNTSRAHYTGFTACESKSHINPEQAAAGLWTTPADLLKVVRALQDSLEAPDDTGFLQRDIAQQMLTEVSSDMALSWFASREPGSAFGHGGSNDPGWRCFLMGYADLCFDSEKSAGSKNDHTPKHSGICVMTNSAQGDDPLWKVIDAITFLKLWPEIPRHLGYQNARIPFAAPEAKVDSRWRSWIGLWLGRWSIQGDGEDLPMAQYADLPSVKLIPAAIPSTQCSEGQSIDLLLEGLEMMMRLGWKNGNRIVELYNGGSGDIIRLERQPGDTLPSDIEVQDK